MDEQVLALLGSLVEIRGELGESVYVGAVERARVAVAHEVLVEAEKRALRGRLRRTVVAAQGEDSVVIEFPRRGGGSADDRSA
ncbi:hypothetical protein BV511_20590 [Methylorubrum extorquens]|uniref:hypothetical protein n=1 Tax=Methylorubrum extorquens TaxID=408 RepID=UPI000972ACC3|nr:hypothetical protein [Methylorubrum extorquens]APX86884.1 hypothetical protein BV511_20590 [Methylorubrum extorquens]